MMNKTLTPETLSELKEIYHCPFEVTAFGIPEVGDLIWLFPMERVIKCLYSNDPHLILNPLTFDMKLLNMLLANGKIVPFTDKASYVKSITVEAEEL